uniref:Anaphase-promoting complex subunit 4-like WD40 domain-containing protein n=1 Tax=Meloidogyne incognita TaxID=6306 RepID=A0A914MF96_MELIC
MKVSAITDSKEFLEKIKVRTKFELLALKMVTLWLSVILGKQDGRNFSRQLPLTQFSALIADESEYSSKQSRNEMVSLCWSPDGQILLSAFSSGHCFYLDTQNGNVLFLRLIEYAPKEIKWIKYQPSCHSLGIDNDPTISAADFNFCDDASKEHAVVCEEIEQFCKKSFNQSLVGTFLCILHEMNNEEIDGTHSLILDILADGVLLVLKINLTHAPVNTSVLSIRTLVFRNNCLRIPLKMDDANPSLSNKEFLVIAGPISPERMCIYNQISKSLCCISFYCIYLQEMLKYCTSNWQQSSEAFHQRVFAIVNNNNPAGILTESRPKQKDGSEGALLMCNDLLMLIETEQPSDLLNNFLNSPTSYKEMKQACSFLDDYSWMRLLVDDTRCVGIRRADGGLVHSIIINTFFTNFVFVHFLCKSFSCAQIQIFVTRKIPKIFVNNLVCETLIVVSNHNDIQLPIFRTLIKGISSGIFPASQQLGHEIRVLHAYFTTLSTNMEYDNEDEFDPVPMLLDTLLKIASGHTAFSLTLGLTLNFHQFFDQFEHSVYLLEQKLQNILLVADKNRQFLDEVVQHSGLNDSDSGRFILDRVFPHLFVYNCQQKIQQPTIEQQMQLCFQHFKIFFKDGLTKFFNMPENCNILVEDKEELYEEEETYNSDE